MNIALPALHALRAPGLAWLPAVWRRQATWKTVLWFGFWGPLVGGLPYVWLLFPIPFAYFIGGLPALFTGLLFACWAHAGPLPKAKWRALVGALCALAAAAVSVVPFVVAAERPEWFMPAVIALHGVPAAVVLALWWGRGRKV
jgi:hypothetical protein